MEEQTEYETIYNKVLIKYGTDRQIDKLIEEMAELTKALMKYKYGFENNVPEEFADVEFLLKQLKPVFNKEEIIDYWQGVKENKMTLKV